MVVSRLNNYFKHYGFDHDPFPVGQEDELFFSTPELEHRLELIRHMVEFSDRFLVVTGLADAGKTTLLRHLIKVVDEKWRINRLSFDKIHTAEDFIYQIYQEQNLDYRESDSVARQIPILQEHFYKIHENNLFPVLLVDDGHRLSIELLKLLMDLAVTEQKSSGLHVIVFSDTDLADLISHKNLSFIHSIDIPALNEEQVRAYLDFRLKEAGHAEEEPLVGEKMLRQIYQASDGLPGLINELATKALNDPALIKQGNSYLASISSLLLNTRLTIPFALILTAVFVVFILQSEETTELETTSIEVDLPTVAADAGTDKEHETIESEAKKEIELEQDEIVVLTVPVNTSEATQKSKNETYSEFDEVINKQISSQTDLPEPVNKMEITVAIQPGSEVKPAKPLTEAPRLVESAPVESAPALVEVPETNKEARVEIKEAPIEGTSKEVKQAAVQISTAGTNSSAIRGNSWLKNQSPEHYVLQLMGAHDESVIKKFIAQHPESRKDMARFKTVNRNKIWHVLLLGIYENREQAIAAIVALPTKIRALKPWPRRVQTIQNDLN